MAPESFAVGIADCLRSGARLVGGFCGTKPEHTLALASVLEKWEKDAHSQSGLLANDRT